MPKKSTHGNGRRDSSRPSSGRSHRQRQRHLSVRGDLRDRPDIRRIARAVIAMELARLEAEAEAEQAAQESPDE